MPLSTYEKYTKQIKILVKILSVLLSGVTLFTSFIPGRLPKDYERAEPSVAETLNTVPTDHDPNAPRLTLADDGESDYTIVYGTETVYAERFAAQELSDYVFEISGARIAVTSDVAEKTTHEIIIGKTNRENAETYSVDRGLLGDDGYRIFVYEDSLVIAGGEKRGTLYGVYTFLEDFYGCRFYSKDFELVPTVETLTVKLSTDVEEKPAFTLRSVYWDCALDSDYMAKSKLNCIQVDSPVEPISDDIEYIRCLNFSFEGIINGADYFETHPEYFFVDAAGNRNPNQLCLTNPEVLEILNNRICAESAAHPECDIITLYTNDTDEYCHCPDCAAVNEAEESVSGTLLRAVNYFAGNLKAVRPDATFRTLIWQVAENPPKLTHPADNVSFQLCTIGANMAKPYETDEVFMRHLNNWSEGGFELNVWDYSTNFTNYTAPCPNVLNIDDNIRLMYDKGVTGYFMQGNAYENSGEFGELRAYITAKLLWNPSCDIDAITKEFLWAYYGAGYKNIEKYIDYIAANAAERFDIICDPEDMLTLDEGQAAQCELWWSAAENAAKNGQELQRVQRSHLQLRYYKSSASLGEFSWYVSLNSKWKAGEKLYDDLNSLGVTYICQGRTMKDKDTAIFLIKANKWKL